MYVDDNGIKWPTPWPVITGQKETWSAVHFRLFRSRGYNCGCQFNLPHRIAQDEIRVLVSFLPIPKHVHAGDDSTRLIM